MKWGLSWGPSPPYHVKVLNVVYEVRTYRAADKTWSAFGDVNGVCVEAKGTTEREARLNWRILVQRMAPVEPAPAEPAPAVHRTLP